MELKYVIATIVNSHISQLHYIISRINQSKEKDFSQEWADLLEMTSKFEKRIKHEYEKPK